MLKHKYILSVIAIILVVFFALIEVNVFVFEVVGTTLEEKGFELEETREVDEKEDGKYTGTTISGSDFAITPNLIATQYFQQLIKNTPSKIGSNNSNKSKLFILYCCLKLNIS